MVVNLSCSLSKIDHIYHISDIHIRLRQRHDEYRDVFQTLYYHLEDAPDNTIVVITGDILHSKTHLSPEAIQLTHELFYNLSKHHPTIIIAGNHDANLSNLTRLDALSPIIEPIQRIEGHQIYYLQYTGIYKIANVFFGVTSVFGTKEKSLFRKIIKSQDIPKEKGTYKIGLCHDTLHNSVLDNQYSLTNSISVKDFDGYDMVLLGDIHKRQFMNGKETIAYAGSLIQQDKGESIHNHGYIKWDVKERTGEFVNIENDYGFYKMSYMDGKFIYHDEDPEGLNIHKYVRLFIDYDDSITDPDLRKKIRKRLSKQNKEVKSISLNKVIVNEFEDIKDQEEIHDFNISDVNKQNYYIEMYLKQETKYSQQEIEELQHFNQNMNKTLNLTEKIHNTIWKLDTLTFTNLFSYGEDNTINFNNMEGILGFIAPNHTGKSSIVDIILYMLFDNCSRCSSTIVVANEILNNKKDKFEASLTFYIDNKKYLIHKKGVKGKVKANSVKVNINFYEIVNDKKVNLNGEQKSDTKKIIESYVGKYDDFLITSTALQNNMKYEFIELTTGNRVDKLNSLLCIDIFDELRKQVTSKNEELKTLLKHSTNHEETIQKLRASNREIDIDMIKLKQKKKDIKKQITLLQTDIDECHKNIKSVNITQNKEELLKTKSSLKTHIKECEEKLNFEGEMDEDEFEELTKKKKDLINQQQTLSKNLKHFDISDHIAEHTLYSIKSKLSKKETNNQAISKNITIYEKKMKKMDKILKEYTQTNEEYDELTKKHKKHLLIEQSYKKIENRIEMNKKQLEKLRKYEYDPECKYCMKNEFVKQILEKEDEIEKDQQELKKYVTTFDNDFYLEYHAKLKEKNEQIKKQHEIQNKLNEYKSKQKDTVQIIEKYTNIREQLIKFDKLEKDNQDVESKLKLINDELNECEKKLSVFENMNNIKTLKLELKNYKYELKDVNEMLKLYEIVEENEKHEKSIKTKKEYIDEYQDEITMIDNKIHKQEMEKGWNDKKIEEYDEIEKKNKQYRKQQILYERYIKMMMKNGLPYYMISKVIPTLERRINSALRKIVDFTIRFDLEHKKSQKYIIMYLVRDDSECPIQLCSGYEKFVTNIITKIGIRSISKVPKSNFMIIDEGFGNFDDDHLNTTVQQLFYYLQSNFDYTLLISHIDILKDYIHTHIHINREGNFSNIKYLQ